MKQISYFIVACISVLLVACGGGGTGSASSGTSSAKAITAFSLGGVAGTINEPAKTIAVTVPSGTAVTAMVATFTTTGTSVAVGATAQVSGTTTNNFTSPVVYTVTAADATTVNYTVTVTVSSSAQTYIYYSQTSPTPQTATLNANGTLSMGVLTLTGFSFGVSATDPSGTLTSWASPWNNINQPKVQAMLLCGSNNKLAYVLIQSNTDDPNRSVSTVPNLLSAIEAAPQYSGMGVYTNCSGTFTTAWNNNLPYTNYYLWPNVFTTYSYAYVANQLSGAAIFYESGQSSNQNNYLAITWNGGSLFEVWQ